MELFILPQATQKAFEFIWKNEKASQANIEWLKVQELKPESNHLAWFGRLRYTS